MTQRKRQTHREIEMPRDRNTERWSQGEIETPKDNDTEKETDT